MREVEGSTGVEGPAVSGAHGRHNNEAVVARVGARSLGVNMASELGTHPLSLARHCRRDAEEEQVSRGKRMCRFLEMIEDRADTRV